MNEFGHKLRRICSHRPARHVMKTNPAPHTVRHPAPPHASVESLWSGPGLGGTDDGA